jgi:uncharacterized protein YgiM (DUF1202 family)
MRHHSVVITTAILLLFSAMLACNINVAPAVQSPAPDLAGTIVAETLAALTASGGSVTPSPGSATPGSNPSPSITAAPSQTATPNPTFASSLPGNALVTTSAVCWLGPGAAYEVSSSIQSGTRVDLLGRGDINGWLVIRNPRYHDPCWIQVGYLQVDTNVNVAALPIYYTPPTPTPTP